MMDKCIFGCRDEPIGLFFLPGGCYCHADQMQFLCEHHWRRATALDGIYWFIYFGA
jgi:hypothetical protein